MSTPSAESKPSAGSTRRPWPTQGFRRFFSRVAPDVVGLLVAQGQVSVRAAAAFLAWSSAGGRAGGDGTTGSGGTAGGDGTTGRGGTTGGDGTTGRGGTAGSGGGLGADRSAGSGAREGRGVSTAPGSSASGGVREGAGGIEREAGPAGPDELAALEREADGARRALLEALRGALATPIDQEDLYLLSERCDRVVNALRDIAAEADELGWRPDSFAESMASHVHAGMGHLVEGFGALHKGHGEAGVAADRATAEGRAVAYVYRDALRALLGPQPLGGTGSPPGGPFLDVVTGRELLTSRELYRSYARLGELVVAVADRLWYAVLAEV